MDYLKEYRDPNVGLGASALGQMSSEAMAIKGKDLEAILSRIHSARNSAYAFNEKGDALIARLYGNGPAVEAQATQNKASMATGLMGEVMEALASLEEVLSKQGQIITVLSNIA